MKIYINIVNEKKYEFLNDCKQKICPYFFSRDTVAMIEAEVLLMPYNYMMDSRIRKTLNFDCTNCVLIIDEAHNIVVPSFSFIIFYRILFV